MYDVSNHGAERGKITVYNVLGHTVARNLFRRQTLTVSEQPNDNITILLRSSASRQYLGCIDVSPKKLVTIYQIKWRHVPEIF